MANLGRSRRTLAHMPVTILAESRSHHSDARAAGREATHAACTDLPHVTVCVVLIGSGHDGVEVLSGVRAVAGESVMLLAATDSTAPRGNAPGFSAVLAIHSDVIDFSGKNSARETSAAALLRRELTKQFARHCSVLTSAPTGVTSFDATAVPTLDALVAELVTAWHK